MVAIREARESISGALNTISKPQFLWNRMREKVGKAARIYKRDTGYKRRETTYPTILHADWLLEFVEVTHDDAVQTSDRIKALHSRERERLLGLCFLVIQSECFTYFRYTKDGRMEAAYTRTPTHHELQQHAETFERKIRFCPTACHRAWSLLSVTIGFFGLSSITMTSKTKKNTTPSTNSLIGRRRRKVIRFRCINQW